MLTTTTQEDTSAMPNPRYQTMLDTLATPTQASYMRAVQAVKAGQATRLPSLATTGTLLAHAATQAHAAYWAQQDLPVTPWPAWLLA
jgi:hypothetical protein